LGLAGS
jgi:hypothetical protein